MDRKYKIFCTTWHVMHYWDLFNALKEDCEFYLCHNNHRSWLDPRFLATRPLPENAQFVPYFEKDKYDLAILNVDQQIANEFIGKGIMQREMMAQVRASDTPLVILNHASPVYPEFLRQNDMTDLESQQECIKLIKEVIQDNTMVVNSHTAATDKEWGWGHPIVHGMDPEEWKPLEKEPRIFTALSPAGCDAYYNRECMNEVERLLKEDFGYKLFWAKANVNFKSPDEYKEFLSRSLIYLDTSFRTPMNRGRTEAFLSGCCVIQVEGAHDLERFSKNGENIILVNNSPKQIATKCVQMLEQNYDKAVEIGKNARKMAIKEFSRERFRQDWLKLIKKLTDK